MNRLSFSIIVLMWLTVAGSSLAQTSYPVPVAGQPCIEDATPGRPTLKRRKTSPDAPAIDGNSGYQKSLETEKCKEDKAGDPPNNQGPIRLRFEGLQAFSEADVVKTFREGQIRLQEMPGSEVLASAVRMIKELLESRGHFQAVVDTREDGAARNVTFLVFEGPRFPLAEVRFTGNRIFPAQELALKTAKCLANYEKAQVGYDTDTFDLCIRRLTDFIRSRGYLQATLGQPIKVFDGRGLVLTIPVDEGALYRLGKIKIEGAEVLSPEQVRMLFGLRQGDAANGEAIGKWLFEDVRKKYGEMGFVQFTAEPEPEFKTAAKGATEGTVDFTVKIEEGQQFRVKAIKFWASDVPDEDLGPLLRIRAGDVFNQRLFEESIGELNKLGRFELIDKDRDADFSTDEELGLIDIVIKLKNRDGKVDLKELSSKRQ